MQPTQKGNEVQGHLAGRDVNITDIRIPSPFGSRSHMQTLIERLKAETESDPELKQTVEVLKNYTLRRGPAIGLTTKLTLANWPEDEIEWAMNLKEMFAKRLETHQFSVAAQHILAHLLAKICHTFKAKVRPIIATGASTEGAQGVAYTEVIDPALKDLEENPLMIHLDEIWGALYFLTGNCHVRWDISE